MGGIAASYDDVNVPRKGAEKPGKRGEDLGVANELKVIEDDGGGCHIDQTGEEIVRCSATTPYCCFIVDDETRSPTFGRRQER